MHDLFGKNADCLLNKRFFLLDQDGTLYNDGSVFPATLPFLAALKARGARYVFITNNSSKSVNDYVRKMQTMGIPCGADDFFTSADATIIYLQSHYPDKTVFVVGTRSLIAQLREAGIRIASTKETADVALLGYDTELSYQKLEDLCWLLSTRDLPYIATNPDWVCPASFGYLPDCGSMAFMVEKATGKLPLFIGKPRPDIMRIAMARYGYTPEETVMVGDRLYTDIAGAKNAGITAVCVLSGEATKADVDHTDTPPDFTFTSIGDILG